METKRTSPSYAAPIRAATKKKKKKSATASVVKQQLQQQQQQWEKQPQQNNEVAEADDAIRSVNNADGDGGAHGYGSGYGSGLGLGMGMGMGNMMMPSYGLGGMMGGMGMYGMGMGGMYGGGGMMGSQWLMSLNQFLFGIQSVVFSLGQAVQIVGMNAQQIQHLYNGARGMVENALGHVNDKLGRIASLDDVVGGAKGGEVVGGAMRWLSVARGKYGHNDNGEDDAASVVTSRGGEDHQISVMTHSEIVRRRRLAVFRWTMTLSASYFLYRAVRRLLRALIHGSINGRGGNDNLPLQQSRNDYYGGGEGGRISHNQYYDNNVMMGGGYGHGSMNRYYNDVGSAGIYGQRRYDYDPYSQGYGNMNGRYY